MNIDLIIQELKFGYTGSTVDLIYMFGWFFVIGFVFYKIFKRIRRKGDFNND